MTPRNAIRFAATAALIALAASGCERDTSGLGLAPLDTDPIVFEDGFGTNVDFAAFLGSKLDAVTLDSSERFRGSASIRVTVPGPNDPPVGGYAGGAFFATVPRDLSSYNALTFWAKASKAATLNVAGLGNDNTGTSKYEASRTNIPMTTTWTKYIIPIPLSSRLSSEGGLFFFAEGHENNLGYQIWFDDIMFESVGGILNPAPSMESPAQAQGVFVGGTVSVRGTKTIFEVSGGNITVQHSPGYFTFMSSNEDVAAVMDGVIRVVGAGNATITATLGSVEVDGSLIVSASGPPTIAAPTPTVPAGDVVSFYGDAYTNVPVYSWLAFGSATIVDLQVAGDDVKAYTNLSFAGIAFKAPPPEPPPAQPTDQIDATQMTHFHMDVWVPDATTFRIKLVDFGSDGRYGGAPDSEHELTFDASSTPPLTNGAWVQLEIPLANFTGLASRAHLAQLIISMVGDEKTVFVDNIYLHK